MKLLLVHLRKERVEPTEFSASCKPMVFQKVLDYTQTLKNNPSQTLTAEHVGTEGAPQAKVLTVSQKLQAIVWVGAVMRGRGKSLQVMFAR